MWVGGLVEMLEESRLFWMVEKVQSRLAVFEYGYSKWKEGWLRLQYLW